MIVFDKNTIINAEDKDEVSHSSSMSSAVLTCGLSMTSTITASSIDDSGFLYCIQRGFLERSGALVLPQEFKINWSRKAENIYPYLEAVTLLLLSGVPPKDITDNLKFCN